MLSRKARGKLLTRCQCTRKGPAKKQQWKGASLLKFKSLASDRGLAPKRFSKFAEGMYEETLFYIVLLLKRRWPYDGGERSYGGKTSIS